VARGGGPSRENSNAGKGAEELRREIEELRMQRAALAAQGGEEEPPRPSAPRRQGSSRSILLAP